MIRIFMIGMSQDKGGVEAYITNLCDHLNQDEFEIIHCWPKMEINGKQWSCPSNRHNYFKYAIFWTTFFKENCFDVVYFNTCDIVSVDMLRFAKKAGVSVRIIHSHSTENQMKMNLFHRITENYNKKHIKDIATHLFACSEEAGKWMFPEYDFVTIKNGIDLSKYMYNNEFRKECRQNIGIGEEYLIGCVGRLDPEKNPLMSVKVMKAISDSVSDAKFVFVGDGRLRGQIEKKIDEYHLDEKIFLIGARDDANKWYSALDCLLMPSLYEGLPFTLVEAQTAGLPCVVSNTVSDEANLTGLVEYVALNDSIETWSKKVLEACAKERSDTTRQLLYAGYSVEDTVKKVIGIIENALKKD